MGETTYMLVCSNKPPLVMHRSGKTGGGQWWKRDVFHVFAGESKTFCGRNSREWIEIGLKEKSKILADGMCCSRCATGLRNRDGAGA